MTKRRMLLLATGPATDASPKVQVLVASPRGQVWRRYLAGDEHQGTAVWGRVREAISSALGDREPVVATLIEVEAAAHAESVRTGSPVPEVTAAVAEATGLLDMPRGPGVWCAREWAPAEAANDEERLRMMVSVPPSELPSAEQHELTGIGGHPYLTRSVGGIPDVELMRSTRRENGNIWLFGPSGSGKTSAMIAAFGNDLVTINGSGDLDTSDFEGTYVYTPGVGWVWHDGPMLIALEGGKVLFIDEMSAISEKIQKILHPMMDGRGWYQPTSNPSRGIVRAAPGFIVGGAVNPRAKGAVDTSTLSRFRLHLEVPTNIRAMVEHFGVDPQLGIVAENLAERSRSGERVWTIEARTMLDFMKNRRSANLQIAAGSMINMAPEAQRSSIADLLSRAYGVRLEPLRSI